MTKLHTHKTAPLKCPVCGAVNDGAMAADHGRHGPQPGSVMICLDCAQAAILTEDMVLRLPTLEEMFELLSVPDFVRALYVAKTYLATHPKAEGTVH